MNSQYTIPSLLILATSTTGCADPIVGTWSADSFTADGETIEIPYEYGGVEIFSSMEMTFDADLTGTMEMVQYSGTDSYTLTATNDGGGAYTILSEDEDSLDCTLSGDSLECSVEDTTISMSKGAKE